MEIKGYAPIFKTKDFWKDIIEEGKINPSDYLKEPIVSSSVKEAIVILRGFKQALEDAGKVNG